MTDAVFETARMAVRRWRDSDLPDLMAVYGDAEAMKWVGDGQPITENECLEWLVVTQRNYAMRGYGMFAVEFKSEPGVIGFCGIVHPDGQEEAEVKYAYLRRFWGRGIATEILRGLIGYGVSAHGITRLIATTAPENSASQAVLTKAGMSRGELRQDEDGEFTQLFEYEVPRSAAFSTALLAVMHEALLPREFPGGRLRRIRPHDLAAFQAYRSLPELARYQGWSPMSDTEALEFLDDVQRAPLFTLGHWVQLGIAEPESDTLIGDIGLYLSEDGTSGEVGFTLQPDSQGRGVATLAVSEALQIFFSATSIACILGITDERNLQSIKLLERVGFEFIESRQVVFRGKPCTERVYALPRYDDQPFPATAPQLKRS